MKTSRFWAAAAGAGAFLSHGLVWAQSVGTITFSTSPPNTASIPTLSGVALMALSIGLAVVAAWAMKRAGKGTVSSTVLFVVTASVLAGAGALLPGQARALFGIDATLQIGQLRSIPFDNLEVPVANPGQQDLYVVSIQPAAGYTVAPTQLTPHCQIGTRLIAGTSYSPAACYVKICSVQTGCQDG